MLVEKILPFLSDKDKRSFALGLVILAAFIIRMMFFTGGVRGSDAYAYALHAFQMATGQYDINTMDSFYGFRFTLLLPTALSYFLFGVNDYASVIFLYISSLLNIGVVFLLADRLSGHKTALLAAIFLALYPLDILMANMISPDSFIPLFSSLAILLYVMAEEKKYSAGAVRFFLIMAGFCLGLAYLSRITSIFLFAALACYHIFRQRSLKALFLLILGFAILLGAEAGYYYFYTGDYLFHYHRIAVHEALVKGPDPDAIVSLLFYPKVMFGFDLTGWAHYGLLWWLVVAGWALAYLRRDTRSALPIFCLIIPFLGFEFGTQSLNEMIPIMKNYNYLSLLTCPAVLISAYALKEGSSIMSQRSRKALFLFLIVIAVMNLYGIYRLTLNIKDDAAPYVAVADALKAGKQRPIYVHHDRWPLFLNYFLRYDPNLDFRMMNDLDENRIVDIANAYIILHKRYLEADTAGRPYPQRLALAEYWHNPPLNWRKLMAYEGRPLYNTVILFHVSDIWEHGR